MAKRKTAGRGSKHLEMRAMGDALGYIFSLSFSPPSISPGSDVLLQMQGLVGIVAGAGAYSFNVVLVSYDSHDVPIASGTSGLTLQPVPVVPPIPLTVQIAAEITHHAAPAGTYKLVAHIFAKKEPSGPWLEVCPSQYLMYTV